MNTAWYCLLYGTLAVGAAGLYALLPGSAGGSRRGGAILLLASLAGLLALGARGLGWAGGRDGYFGALGVLAVVAAVRVITHRKPVYSALYFVVVVLAVAAMIVLAEGPFLAAALVIIYAGAILVTYLFVIMLAQSEAAQEYDVKAREPLAAVLIGFLLVGCVASLLTESPAPLVTGDARPAGRLSPDSPGLTDSDNVRQIGSPLMIRYVVALEVGGVLLLVAIVGGVWVAGRRVPEATAGSPAAPAGRIGREVAPF